MEDTKKEKDYSNLLSRFCPRCGAIYPTVSKGDMVSCKVCNYSTKHKYVEEYSCVVFDHPWLKEKDMKKSVNSKDAGTGPTVERKCSNCGHTRMSYATQQLRSADEGQTVFYTCVECQHQEVENS